MRDTVQAVDVTRQISHADTVKGAPPPPPLLAEILDRLALISKEIAAQAEGLCSVGDRVFGAQPESEGHGISVSSSGLAESIFNALDAIDFGLRELRGHGLRLERIG